MSSYDRDYRGSSSSSYGGGSSSRYDDRGSSSRYDDRSAAPRSYYDDRARGGYDDRSRGGYDSAPRRPQMGGRGRLYVCNIGRADVPALERLFDKYGRIIDIALKQGFAFVEFADERDAMDAVRGRDGYEFEGQRLRVEHSKPRGAPAGPGGMGGGGGGFGQDSRAPPKCFNCGQEGHIARECKNGDWSNRCYVCKEEGHRSNSCPQRGGGMAAQRSDLPPPQASSSSSNGNGEERRRSRSRERSPRRSSRSRSRERDSGNGQQAGDAAAADSAPAPDHHD